MAGRLVPGRPDRENQCNPAGPAAPNTLYGQAKTARETYAAKLAELEYRKKAGDVIEFQVAAQCMYDLAVAVRDKFLSMPDRLSAIFSGETDEKKIHTIMSDEIKAILRNMASERIDEELAGVKE